MRIFLFLIILKIISYINCSTEGYECYSYYPIQISAVPSIKPISLHLSQESSLLFIAHNDSTIKTFNLQTSFISFQTQLIYSKTLHLFFRLSNTMDLFLIIYTDLSAEIRNFKANWLIESNLKLNELPVAMYSSELLENFYLATGNNLKKYNFRGEFLGSWNLNKTKKISYILGYNNYDWLLIHSNDNFLTFFNMKYEIIESFVIDIFEKISSFYFYSDDIIIIGTYQGNLIFVNIDKRNIILKIKNLHKNEINQIYCYKNFVITLDFDGIKLGIYNENKYRLYRNFSKEGIKNFVFYQEKSKNNFQIYLIEKNNNIINAFKIQFFYLSKCLTICPKGTFFKEINGFLCKNCSKNCSECINNEICTKCDKSLFLDNGKCVSSCGVFKYLDEETRTCETRMVSWSFTISAFALFLGMELVRKFWKQIRNYIRRGLKDLCQRKRREILDNDSTGNKRKIRELEEKINILTSDLQTEQSQKLVVMKKLLEYENNLNNLELTEPNIKLSKYKQNEYATLLPYEDILYSKSKQNRIGKGGFGTIYSSLLFGKFMAVKKFSFLLSGCSTLDIEEMRKIINELIIMNTLSHERILKMRYFAIRSKKTKISFKIVSDLLSTDLHKLLNNEPDLSFKEKLRISKEILDGLIYLHSKEIQHLDLKPHNILLDTNKQIKIADFGLSKQLNANTQRTSVFGVSYPYASREYVIENRVSPKKSDIWSFGTILFEIFSGKKPWEGLSVDEIRNCLEQKVEFFSKNKCDSLPKEIKEIINLCLVHETDKRIDSESLSKIFPKENNEEKYLKTLKSNN